MLWKIIFKLIYLIFMLMYVVRMHVYLKFKANDLKGTHQVKAVFKCIHTLILKWQFGGIVFWKSFKYLHNLLA